MIVSEQADPDPEFSTVDFPNPEEGASALNLSVQKVKGKKPSCVEFLKTFITFQYFPMKLLDIKMF